MASFKLLTASQVSKQLSMDDAVRVVKEGGITMYAAAKQHSQLMDNEVSAIIGLMDELRITPPNTTAKLLRSMDDFRVTMPSALGDVIHRTD
ncbi:hypothetical protein RvY_13123 [Ramazzottius varieornatus]|uniref:Uncharacterized protein n=1 Tax=Ramazzottius varieornatus TaxID=947166 RepID=A0A1D1VVE7_RAMVA|nr:hypothetical protein RvY_13123 [Ramazzottius varieornatus]